MKKIFTLAAVMATSLIFAQNESTDAQEKKSTKHTVSLNGMYSEPGQMGLSYEYYDTAKNKSYGKSFVANVSIGVMNYDSDIVDVDGTGFVIELGGRTYYGKERGGLYTSNYLSYGSIEFDESTLFGKFKGTYSYFSFFSPEIGYKIKFGNVSIDPYIGGMWKIEVKGKGDIDNNNTDEWVLRGGLRVGYSF